MTRLASEGPPAMVSTMTLGDIADMLNCPVGLAAARPITGLATLADAVIDRLGAAPGR